MIRTIVSKIKYEKSLSFVLEQIIDVIANTINSRDSYTSGHQKRTAELCCAIAEKLNLDNDVIQGLDLAASIHDLGKIGIPADIIFKPDKLSLIEYMLVKSHVVIGYEIIKDIKFPWPIAKIILQHHERENGSGYPNGITSDEILLEAKILAVADSVEAMISHRPYRPSLGKLKALEVIYESRGIEYDSDVVDACIEVFNDGFVFKN